MIRPRPAARTSPAARLGRVILRHAARERCSPQDAVAPVRRQYGELYRRTLAKLEGGPGWLVIEERDGEVIDAYLERAR